VDVTLAALKEEGERADSSPQDQSAAPGDRSSALGIAVGEEEGHVVVGRVASDGPSDGKLRPGDVIDEIGGQHVASASDLASKVHAAAGSGKPVLLRVKRGDQSLFVAIDTGASAAKR
jgi:S1-C subfamily serine protease